MVVRIGAVPCALTWHARNALRPRDHSGAAAASAVHLKAAPPSSSTSNIGTLRSVAATATAFAAAAGALARARTSTKCIVAAGRPRAAQRRGVTATAAAAATEVSYMTSKVQEMAALQPVMVFSKSWCPYCAKAKQALTEAGIKYAVLELDSLGADVEAEVQDVLAGLTGARSVPRVFIGGVCIGGGDDAVRLAAEGKLKEIAEKAIDEHRTAVGGKREFQLQKAQDEWQKELDATKFRILRQRGTEPPRSHEYDKFLPKAGHFGCAGCGLALYSASSKYASSCGWPVFDKCYTSGDLGQHVTGQPDGSGSLEIVCTRCGSHLGHVFYDAVSNSNPNGERH